MNTSKSLDDFDRILWHALASAVTASINSDSNDTVDLTEQVFEQAKKDLLAAIVEAVEGIYGDSDGLREFAGLNLIKPVPKVPSKRKEQ